MSPSLATNQASDGALLRADSVRRQEPSDFIASEQRATATKPLRLGSWLLESVLAEGTLTQIHRARAAGAASDKQLPGQYVVKVLREIWHEQPAQIAQIRQEATVGRCVSHRHLSPILAAHIHRPPYYIVLPWLDGANVAAHLAAQGRLAMPLALWIARQAAQALEALHTAGYVHGDVNPRNLFLNMNGHVTLLDLSCSRRIGDGAEQSASAIEESTLSGTPKYLAPEIFIGQHANPRSDLYSLGLTLFEMLIGRPPPMPDEMAILAVFKREAMLPNVRDFAPWVPLEIADLVRKLTAHDPLRRPHTAREVMNSLIRLEIVTLQERVPT
jgi:eukaryotic-like serine/threonine-protein kinase